MAFAKDLISVAVRRALFKTPLKPALLHRYEYFFWPRELAFLCGQLEKTIDVPGSILEIGCARGATTVFLNKHIDCLELWDLKCPLEKAYVCIDTFAGFVKEHVEHEQRERGWSEELYDDFRLNDVSWFEAMLRQNEVKRARAIQADAAEFDYRSLGPLSFVLLDVDLYLPIIRSLPKIYEMLSPGGILIVDDCQPTQKYDGARQAYIEFIRNLGLPERYEHRKFGMIEKPATA